MIKLKATVDKMGNPTYIASSNIEALDGSDLPEIPNGFGRTPEVAIDMYFHNVSSTIAWMLEFYNSGHGVKLDMSEEEITNIETVMGKTIKHPKNVTAPDVSKIVPMNNKIEVQNDR